MRQGTTGPAGPGQRGAALLSFIMLALLGACLIPTPSSVNLTTEVDAAGRPLNQTGDFSIDAPRILCSAQVAGLPPADILGAAWLYRDAGSWQTIKMESFSISNASYIVFGIDAPLTGWRQGQYAVKLSLRGREIRTLNFSVGAAATVPLPVIDHLTATPEGVVQGQPSTLSWNVSGASRVVIEPGIGAVGAGGSRQVTPAADTTFTLTALNSGGTSSASISMRVLPRPAGQADLVVLDLFRESVMVYYTVQNQGTAASQPCNAQLYVGPNLLSTDYLPPLEPGQKRTEVFGQYGWTYPGTTTATVCVDTDMQNRESNRDNNCLTRQLPGARVL